MIVARPRRLREQRLRADRADRHVHGRRRTAAAVNAASASARSRSPFVLLGIFGAPGLDATGPGRQHRDLRGRVLLRVDDPEPPALHGAARAARRDRSSASATRKRSGPWPTSGCASRRSCTMSSRTRWASSRCRRASARTSSTPIRPRRRSRSKRSPTTSRSTLTEIRRMLGVLREDDGRRVRTRARSRRTAAPRRVGPRRRPRGRRARRGRATATCRPACRSPRTASCRRR